MTLFLMPVIYYILNKRSDERAAKAEARRERIAAGLKRKDAKTAANAGVVAEVNR
jgi:HAE1 family hydrophobic/amphiphilic exporter-1